MRRASSARGEHGGIEQGATFVSLTHTGAPHTAAIGFDSAGTMDGIVLGWVVMVAHGHTPTIVRKSSGRGG